MTSLSLGNKKKSQGGCFWRSGEQDLESRVVAPLQQCHVWQETPEFPRHYELQHCHDEAAMTSFPTVLFFSLSLSASDVARCFCRRADK